MSSNIGSDLAKGASRFTPGWKLLLRVCLLGWFLALVAGFTGWMALWWFAVWVIPLSLVLFWKAAMSYFETMDSGED